MILQSEQPCSILEMQHGGDMEMVKKFWNSELINALALVAMLYFMAR
jgi:hypothetical protein